MGYIRHQARLIKLNFSVAGPPCMGGLGPNDWERVQNNIFSKLQQVRQKGHVSCTDPPLDPSVHLVQYTHMEVTSPMWFGTPITN